MADNNKSVYIERKEIEYALKNAPKDLGISAYSDEEIKRIVDYMVPTYVPEVVRCNECTFYETCYIRHVASSFINTEHGFCSRGQRAKD